jgi:predicted HicB family RNase H-like nuclease
MSDLANNEFPLTFPLRLPTSIRRQAGVFAKTEGISLNQFIMLAVAEKLSKMEKNWAETARPSWFSF